MMTKPMECMEHRSQLILDKITTLDKSTILGKITIVGMGLIGGSLGMALAAKGFGRQVWGVDVHQDTLELAAQMQAGHQFTQDLLAGVDNADLVILATPVGKTKEILQRIAGHLKPGCLVTDVGSVKASVVAAAQQILPEQVEFLGGHPMAGSEAEGIKGADIGMFGQAVYILTPTERTSTGALQTLHGMIEAIGAQMVVHSPAEHDLLVAGVSHLPHLVAVALVNTVRGLEEENPAALKLAAGGFRDTTRVASSQSLIWRDIFLNNREATLMLLDRFKQSVLALEQVIMAEDSCGIEGLLEQARVTRQRITEKI